MTALDSESSQTPAEASTETTAPAVEHEDLPAGNAAPDALKVDSAEAGSPLPPLPPRRDRHSLPPIPSSETKEPFSLRPIQSASHLTTEPLSAAASATDDVEATKTTETSRPSADMEPIRRLPSSLSSSSVDDPDINTIPDPRKRVRGPVSPRVDGQGGGAEDEVTTLSTKLIDAINYQSTLDDTLSRTRLELEQERDKVRKLEALAARQKEFLAGGLWVRRSTVEDEKAQILAKAREDKRLRIEAEEAKKRIELELEALTAELFDQANKMVSAAKEEAQREQQAAARRYDNLKAQLADTEGLLRSQQEQLTELKQVMEGMISAESGDARSRADDQASAIPTPSSPGGGHFSFEEPNTTSAAALVLRDTTTREKDNTTHPTATDGDAVNGSTGREGADDAVPPSPAATTTTTTTAAPTTATTPTTLPSSLSAGALPLSDALPLSPSSPMSFHHLLRPVFRYDTAAYFEFVELVRAAQIQLMLQQNIMPLAHGRTPSSTSLPKTPPMGASTWTPSSSSAAPTAAASAGPGAPLVATNTFTAITSGLSGTSSAASPQNHVKDLKDSKYYKRVLVEDIEPTLRLDTAPGISWLVRRSVVAAVVEGTLVVEPVPPNSPGLSLLIHSHCALCGESRPDEGFLRRYRFRLTESDKSTPYPLCGYCLGRVRSVCGFVVFLRMIMEGHWRASDEGAEHAAWEECVRLRELMFWARIGGGVLPAATHGSHNSNSGGLLSAISNGGGGSSAARHSREASGPRAVSGPAGLLTATTVTSGHGGGTEDATAGRPGLSSSSRPSTPAAAKPSSSLAIMTGINDAAGSGSSSSSRPTPSRPYKLSATVAAMVSGMGGHVS